MIALIGCENIEKEIAEVFAFTLFGHLEEPLRGDETMVSRALLATFLDGRLVGAVDHTPEYLASAALRRRKTQGEG